MIYGIHCTLCMFWVGPGIYIVYAHLQSVDYDLKSVGIWCKVYVVSSEVSAGIYITLRECLL